MTDERLPVIKINSISEQHHYMGLPKPEHPLISIFKIDDLPRTNHDAVRMTMNLYTISLKRNVDNKIKYGQSYYDFDEGIMGLMSPGQIFTNDHRGNITGWFLAFHPDFIRNYPLGQKIKDYGFFSYHVNEALHVSEKEESMILNIMDSIKKEYHASIDNYSQDVMVSHLEVLLNYTNRFYNRQFITRKTPNLELVNKIENLLTVYLDNELGQEHGLPTVQYLSEQLNISANYLSDMLRKYTGQSAQKHIHYQLTEKAKNYLVTTTLSVSEISYLLGFEHPQSFSKWFKSKTDQSPVEYRSSFH